MDAVTAEDNEQQRRENARIDVEIARNLRDTDYGAVLLSRGQAIVAYDDEGKLRRYFPDGSNELLDS